MKVSDLIRLLERVDPTVEVLVERKDGPSATFINSVVQHNPVGNPAWVGLIIDNMWIGYVDNVFNYDYKDHPEKGEEIE